jgi:hypothetical protein
MLEKMLEKSVSGVSPEGPTRAVDKNSIYFEFSKITSLNPENFEHVDGHYLRHKASAHMPISQTFLVRMSL